MADRILLIVGADASRRDAGPRTDYEVMARTMAAEIIDRRAIAQSRLARAIRRVAGLGPAMAWLAFRARSMADVIVTDGEHIGIPFALLLALARSRVKHVTIGHRLSSRKKRVFLRTLRAHRRIDRIALHSREQHDIAINTLRIPPGRLALVPYQVDTAFWSPQPGAEGRLVLSVGLEHRDYPTLLEAASGIDAEIVIAAGSHWSRHAFAAGELPANVTAESFSYVPLRELYQRAAVVVVPLVDIDNQAGVTTILEAMAMGKPVVVSQSRGQIDVVEDRRTRERGEPRPRPIGLVHALAEEGALPLLPNGFYVPPGDAAALSRAVTYLLDHPEERARLGRAGRTLVESLFTVEQFAARMHALVRSTLGDTPTTATGIAAATADSGAMT